MCACDWPIFYPIKCVSKMALAEVEKLRGRHAALTIAAVVILLGIPLWWKTTQTYRAWLPYAHIKELDSLRLQLSMEVEVVFSRGTLSPEQQKKVPITQTREQEHQVHASTTLKYHYETKYRTATVMEEDALSQPTAAEADQALHTLTDSPCGSVVVYVLPQASSLFPADKQVYVGRHRTALLRGKAVGVSGVKELLAALQPHVDQVVQTVSFSHRDITAALADRVPVARFSKDSLADSMRAFKSSPGYEITFSLLNPDPKSHDLHWDIEGALRTYIQPLLDKLAPVANHSVDSQILYYAALGVNPRYDANASAFLLSADSLAHVINPVEARLGSNAASANPVLNFLLYVPDAQHSPLFIQDRNRHLVASNAFHSPRWGGIMVYNVNDRYGPDAQLPVPISMDMAHVMSVFLTQLRLMLGVQTAHPPPGFLLQSPGSAGLTDWELDRLQWTRSVENVATASTTLTSLAQLLDQIGNIVINDNIAEQVYSAVTSLQAAVAELEVGNLAFALQYSREAILASQRAFFDPSLLHLLYFPDDQKFAIYIPLFLPMCVPILLSLLKMSSEVRRWRSEQRRKRD